MLSLTAETEIFLAVQPMDFRRQIDGLSAVCRQMKVDPSSGKWFVFINRARTMIRVLSYQDRGYWLLTKRLSKGRYRYWPSGKKVSGLCSIEAKYLTRLLKGLLKGEPEVS